MSAKEKISPNVTGVVSRREKRLLLRKGSTKDRVTTYMDNKGSDYQYKWIAQIASLYNLIMGCFRNGFPIAVAKLWYPAWAFYPFFFIRKDLRVANPIVVLNHERIHCRQQRELHILISIPIILFSLGMYLFGHSEFLDLLWIVPFVPTIIYMLNFIWELSPNRSISETRENTCFEREAVSRSVNANYLYTRKPFSFIAYLGIKRFAKYGIK